MYARFFKRALDIFLSLFALIALLPVFAVVTVLVLIEFGRPVFFCQKRPGRHEKIFTMYKFRTMTDARTQDGALLPDADRLTKFGRFLRSTSLDELPELINILKGDMSLVGPRPLLVQYLPLYSPQQRRRHELRPGLTGLAQVNGRNAISWEKKFELDVQYVDSVTFAGDCKILWNTVKKVLRREGIQQQGEATMSYFTGTALVSAGEEKTGASIS